MSVAVLRSMPCVAGGAGDLEELLGVLVARVGHEDQLGELGGLVVVLGHEGRVGALVVGAQLVSDAVALGGLLAVPTGLLEHALDDSLLGNLSGTPGYCLEIDRLPVGEIHTQGLEIQGAALLLFRTMPQTLLPILLLSSSSSSSSSSSFSPGAQPAEDNTGARARPLLKPDLTSVSGSEKALRYAATPRRR